MNIGSLVSNREDGVLVDRGERESSRGTGVRGDWGVSSGVDTAVGVDSQVPDDLGVPGSPASPESVKSVSL